MRRILIVVVLAALVYGCEPTVVEPTHTYVCKRDTYTGKQVCRTPQED